MVRAFRNKTPSDGKQRREILWDFNVESERVSVHRRPDIVVLEKEERNVLLIDIDVPGDV